MDKLKITWTRQRLSLALVLLPIVFLVGLMVIKTVNVPYWDEWEFVPLIQHVHAGHFYFNDFWQQHNEHRILFPRLIMIASAVITGWNIRIESFISFVIAGCSFLVIMKTLGLTLQKLKQKLPFILPLLLSLIWFSPVQVENWFWGWQIQWFLNVFGIVLVTLGIARIKGRILKYPDLLLLITGGVIASYSLGNGVLIWPLLVAALLYARVPAVKTTIATVAGLITTGLYYHNYVSPEPASQKSLVFHEPVLFVKYMLTYLGRPLSFTHKLTPLLGLALLLIFAGTTTFIFVKRRSTFRALLPWVVLGLYALGSSIITAISRIGLGLEQAYSSRYTTISSLFLVSTIIICIGCQDIFRKWLGRRFKLIVTVAALAVFALVLVNMAWGVRSTYKRSQELKTNQTCTHITKPTDACLAYAYPYKIVVQQRLEYLKQIHWGGY